MKKPRVAFCPCDDANLPFFVKMQNSLRKFHSEKELPLIRYEMKEIQDPMKWYKATPLIAKELIKDYDFVLKLDADQIITGDISEAWKGEQDVAVVQNSNPREHAAYPIQCLDIHPLQYVNCGFVGMRSEEFINHWFNLCQSYHFNNWQYREQDLLNIMVHYGNYNIKWLDASNKWYGLISKGFWAQIELTTHICTKEVCNHNFQPRLILPKNEEWPQDEDKQIVCIHFAGGNDPDKGNYRIRFKPEVVKRLELLTKGGENNAK